MRFVQRSSPYQLPGYEDFLSGLLHARGINTPAEAEDFLYPSMQALHDPLLLQGMDKAVHIIREMGERRARAVIYGDYDVDGICSCLIAKEALEAAGLHCIVYIPDRHQEGYGINREAVLKLSSQAELLLTVDCGITAVDEVKLAKELGMTVIITDHHQPPEKLPQADAVINPLLGDYPFPPLCGAGTAWKLSLALHGQSFADKQLDLAAMATIADLVPLLGENRIIAFFGLKAIAQSSRPGIIALMKVAGLQPGKSVSSDRVAFALAPRLNAGGRLKSAQAALDLVSTNSEDTAQELAQELSELNSRRQQEEREIIRACHQQLESVDLLHRHSILLCAEGWNKGLVGLAAGRLAETYGLPCLVLSQEGEQAAGSGRTAGPVDLYAALHTCQDLFLRFGGHQAAAGLTVDIKNIPELRQRFEEAVKIQLKGEPLVKQIMYDSELDLSKVTVEGIKKLELLEPFGMRNPSPGFLLKDVELLNARRVGADMRHLKLSFRKGSDIRDGIGFGFGEESASVPPRMHAIVKLSINEFQNRINPQFQLQAYKAAKLAFVADVKLERQIILRDIEAIVSKNHLEPAQIMRVDQVEGFFGSLLFCRCETTANRMHNLYPDFLTVTSGYIDRRGNNAVLYNVPLENINAPCESFYFCDGLISPQEADYAQTLFPKARLFSEDKTPQLQVLLASLHHSIEELREIYIKLRQGQCIIEVGPDLERAMAAAKILEEIGLILLNGNNVTLLPVKQADPRESLIYKLLN